MGRDEIGRSNMLCVNHWWVRYVMLRLLRLQEALTLAGLLDRYRQQKAQSAGLSANEMPRLIGIVAENRGVSSLLVVDVLLSVPCRGHD
jgi:hypothetical protein